MDNDYNNGYDPANGVPQSDDQVIPAEDFSENASRVYEQNAGAYQQYNNGCDQSANYGQDGGYGENNYPVTPVTPPPQDFSGMYDQMFNNNQGASGIAITALIMSIAGLVLTLIGTIACCCGGHLIIILGMLASAAGTVLGILNKVWNKPGSGLANAGIIVGAIGLVWGAVMFALLIIPLMAEALDSY